MTSRRRFFARVATLTVGSVAVVACGKGDDSEIETIKGSATGSMEPDRQ